MDEQKFTDWLAGLPALTTAQKRRLEAALEGSDPAVGVARELDVMGGLGMPTLPGLFS